MHQNETIFTGKESIKEFEKLISQSEKTYSSVFILTDTNTRKHCLPMLDSRFSLPENAVILELKPGERNKNIETCIKIWNELAMLGADRHSLLICLGGGVVCDMGGFVASTYQRGIAFVYLPTTLLAQVDAAIGGKTGVNLGLLKNYIGLFSPPDAVYIFNEFLRTLPSCEMLSGYAEVVKHSLLSSEKAYRQLLTDIPDRDSLKKVDSWSNIVERSVNIKSNVVRSDPFEQGLRKVLNLGHTVGHAFESYSLEKDRKPLLHGFAVAMGLIVELKISVRLCGFSETLADQITHYLLSLYSLFSFKDDEITEITHLMGFDKKNIHGSIRMTLLKEPGDLITDQTCSKEVIELALKEYLQSGNQHSSNNGK